MVMVVVGRRLGELNEVTVLQAKHSARFSRAQPINHSLPLLWPC